LEKDNKTIIMYFFPFPPLSPLLYRIISLYLFKRRVGSCGLGCGVEFWAGCWFFRPMEAGKICRRAWDLGALFSLSLYLLGVALLGQREEATVFSSNEPQQK
jgi:hypothetical protein